MNFKSLISENNKDISMGRISFWILLAILLFLWTGKFAFIWIYGTESIETINSAFMIPDGLMEAWTLLLSYNAFKKLPKVNETKKE